MQIKFIFFSFLFLILISCTATGTLEKIVSADRLESYFVDSKGLRQGKYVKYFESGQVYEEGQYRDGYLTGKYSVFFKNGKRYLEKNYLKGELIDTLKLFNRNGSLASYTFYEEGKKSRTTQFDSIGRKIEENSFFCNGELINSIVKYDENGAVLERESKFCELEWIDNETLGITFRGDLFTDSIYIDFKKSFKYEGNLKFNSNYFKRIKFSDRSLIRLDVKKSDFINGKLNLYIQTFRYKLDESLSKLSRKEYQIDPWVKETYSIAVQLTSDMPLPKNNLNHISCDE